MDTKTINQILGITESYQAPKTLMDILIGDVAKREEKFNEFLDAEQRLDHDWFHEYFQDEHADRKMKKQDFTPNSVGILLAELTGEGEGSNLDVAAGTGGLTIQKWDTDRKKVPPFRYYPSNYFYQCEELSDRTIPFLLFNLMIRGMNAVVLHGDSLTREFKQAYFIQNERNDFMHFSSLNVFPHTNLVADVLVIRKWMEESFEHTESKVWPEFLKAYEPKTQTSLF